MQDAVKNAVFPPALSDLEIRGPIARQMDIFFYERIFSDFAKNEIYAETEEKFRLREDDQNIVGMWRGEFWGKWVISACRVCRYKKDEELKAFLHQAALKLISTADENGYIGTYKNPLNCFAPDPDEAEKAVGWKSNWNWNIWCRKYTLWGLLECYELTGDEAILQGAVRTTDQLLDMLEDNHIRLGSTGTFCGMPSGSILKPMLILYRHTENPRYLHFAVAIGEDWDREDGLAPNLVKNGLKNIPVHTWYPNPEKWAKAYEMMSCLDGLLELYRVTGTEKYFTAVKNIYEQLKKHERNTVLSVGFNDLFIHGGEGMNACSEPCDVLHWMRVCSELYKLTGDPEYMHTMEEAFLNPFLAASFENGKWGARAVRTVGRHQVAVGQSSMKYSHCCVNNMPRGYMNALESFVMKGEKGIYVNLYTPFACKFDDARVEIGGSYLENGKVSILVETEKADTLFLRLPPWSRETIINGKKVCAPGTYYAMNLSAGKQEIYVQFDMNPRLVEETEEPVTYPDNGHIRVRRMLQGNDIPADYLVWEKKARMFYGPLLLCRSKRIGSTEEEMLSAPTVCGKGYAVQAEPVEADAVRNAYRVTFENDRERREMILCDYATGTNLWSENDPLLFHIWL